MTTGRPENESAIRIAPATLEAFAADLFQRAGLAEERASKLAAILVSADLLGYATHGSSRIADNVAWIVSGEIPATGEIVQISDRGACQVWDAGFLPGPWVLRRAIDSACERARYHGIAAVAVGRIRHVAGVMTHLEHAAAQDLIALVAVSSPSELAVAPHGGVDPVFSTNPVAFALPTDSMPVLADFSTSATSLGKVWAASDAGRMLPADQLVLPNGAATADPTALRAVPPAFIRPAGGDVDGYKGTALGLLVEALSANLSGNVRADHPQDGEANAVFVQVIDPAAFGGTAVFKRGTGYLAGSIRCSRPRKPGVPVRVPGERALTGRVALQDGLPLTAEVAASLCRAAERVGAPIPAELSRHGLVAQPR